MEILCKEEIEFSYALRFVFTTLSSILHKTVLGITVNSYVHNVHMQLGAILMDRDVYSST